jgi:hypothetical protein
LSITEVLALYHGAKLTLWGAEYPRLFVVTEEEGRYSVSEGFSGNTLFYYHKENLTYEEFASEKTNFGIPAEVMEAEWKPYFTHPAVEMAYMLKVFGEDLKDAGLL